jgi:hypothetical protein
MNDGSTIGFEAEPVVVGDIELEKAITTRTTAKGIFEDL